MQGCRTWPGAPPHREAPRKRRPSPLTSRPHTSAAMPRPHSPGKGHLACPPKSMGWRALPRAWAGAGLSLALRTLAGQMNVRSRLGSVSTYSATHKTHPYILFFFFFGIFIMIYSWRQRSYNYLFCSQRKQDLERLCISPRSYSNYMPELKFEHGIN